MIGVFAVHDNKAEAFQQPFFTQATGLALRMFADGVNNPESIWNRHPNDFCLYQIGEFDEKTGELKAMKPKNLGLATDYIENAESRDAQMRLVE